MKTILSFSIVCFLLSFTSCKKCQECITTTEQGASGYTQTTSTSNEYCGDNYDDAPQEGTYDQSAGGAIQIVTITCSDK